MNTSINPPISQSQPVRIAHYRIVRKLGQGGMSIVYEGIDERLKRPVALKILHPFLAESHEYRSRFFREAQAVARLTHPNIMQIYDVSNSDEKTDQLYIVTELLVGQTLKELVNKYNLIELPEFSAMIVWETAQALEHAHQRGIIHRDIKPENIMVSNNGHIKLMDFGIASIGNDESITQSGTLLGSLAHLSPEVIKGEKATVASDIYSLTTVLFWLLTNRLPFLGESPHALLKAIVDMPHQQVQYLSPYVSDDLADVVELGMKKEPALRFKTAHLLGEAIEKALLKLGISIDTKQIQAVLKDPSTQLMKYKTTLIHQIKKQQAVYQQAKNDAGVLALACRLEANPLSKANLKCKNANVVRKMVCILMAPFLIALGYMALSEFFIKPKEITIIKATEKLVTNSPVILSKEMDENREVHAENQLPLVIEEKQKPSPKQLIEIVVWPFATISHNGKIIGKDLKSIKLKLETGSHKFIFTHLYAATVEKILNITEIKAPFELNISLIKTKPAFLVIKSNVDGDVAVDGRFRGSAKKSEQNPIVIPMPDKTHAQTKEIIVSRENFIPVILETEFIAGQTKEIEVHLKPVFKQD